MKVKIDFIYTGKQITGERVCLSQHTNGPCERKRERERERETEWHKQRWVKRFSTIVNYNNYGDSEQQQS